MDATAGHRLNYETVPARQASFVLVLLGAVYAALLTTARQGPTLYESACSRSHRCPHDVDGTNVRARGTTPIYVQDRRVCDDLSQCKPDICYLNLDGSIDSSVQVAGLVSLNQWLLFEAAVESRSPRSAASHDVALKVSLHAQGADLAHAEAKPQAGAAISPARQPRAAEPKATALRQDVRARRALDCTARPHGPGMCEPLFLLFEPRVRRPLYAASVHLEPMSDDIVVGDVHVCMHTASAEASAFLLGLRVGMLLVAALALGGFGVRLLRLPERAWAPQQQWTVGLLVATLGFNQPLLPLLLSTDGLAVPAMAAALQSALPVGVLAWCVECFEGLVARPHGRRAATLRRDGWMLAALVTWALLAASWTNERTDMTAHPTRARAVWAGGGPLPAAARALLVGCLAALLGSACLRLHALHGRIAANGFVHVTIAVLTLFVAFAAAGGSALGSLSLLPPTALGAVATSGALNLYVFTLAYLHMPVRDF